MKALLHKLFASAQSRSLVAFPFVGTTTNDAFARWIDDGGPWAIGRAPTTTIPRQADVLVVVGQISQKLAPVLVRAHAQLAQPSWVLQIASSAPKPCYALIQAVDEVIPVDVVIRGNPPTEAQIAEGIAALEGLVRSHEGAQ